MRESPRSSGKTIRSRPQKAERKKPSAAGAASSGTFAWNAGFISSNPVCSPLARMRFFLKLLPNSDINSAAHAKNVSGQTVQKTMQHTHRFLLSVVFYSAALIASTNFLKAQVAPTPPIGAGAINESSLVLLKGNHHPLANAANDRGPAAPDLPMERMLVRDRW